MAKTSTQIDIRKKLPSILALAGKREVSETVDFPISSKNMRERWWTSNLKICKSIRKLTLKLRRMILLSKSYLTKKGKISRLWLTMIEVSDITTALHFYNKILELPVALEARKFNHAEVGPKEPLAKIGLHETGKKTMSNKRTGIVFETDDIYAFYNRLKDQNVRFTLKPTKMPWGGIVADFLDPDNNELEIVQDPDHYKRQY